MILALLCTKSRFKEGRAYGEICVLPDYFLDMSCFSSPWMTLKCNQMHASADLGANQGFPCFSVPFNFNFNLPQLQASSSEIIEREIRYESCVTVELNSPRKQTRLHSFMVVMNLLFSFSPTHWDFSHLKLTYDHQRDWWVSFFVFSLFCPF